ncbi:XtrA/YqaO family protein [Sporolactobacillus laevolacticus]|uniref:XtrA/YqaO family protein n=1 Tax=Sporolactobacillus laevolacticus TaxID=33018 RepID=UPI003F494291
MLIVILDGVQGKAKVTEAVEHGCTIIETAKGKKLLKLSMMMENYFRAVERNDGGEYLRYWFF